jgi:heterotetrameric sarcosine oxidase gamma subunit
MNDAVAPLGRSSIAPAAPVVEWRGWEVSGRRSTAPLRLADWSAFPKTWHRTELDGTLARTHPTPFGRARRLGPDHLEIGSEPGAWLVVGPLPRGDDGENDAVPVEQDDDGFATTVDVTHGRALVRLSGLDSARVLEKICPLDLGDSSAPNHTAFRSTVAHLVTDIVRDDLDDGTRSYLLHCDRSSGQYLFDSILDAGAEFGIDVDGFPAG